MEVREMDVLIIGAGPAGTCAAALLKKEGFDSVIVERTKFPRFVIGESLLPRCMDHLEEAGLLNAVRAQNFMVKWGAEIKRGAITASIDFRQKFSDGWDYTYQVPRADFDKTLADAVEEMGIPIHYEHEVTEAHFNYPDIKVHVRPVGGTEFIARPKFVLDASGYGRVLPRLLDLDRPSDFPVRSALAVHFWGDRRPSGEAEGKIWVVSHQHREDVWFWIIPFSNGKTSVGAVGLPGFFEQFSGTPVERMRAIIKSEAVVWERCHDAEFDFEPRSISGYSAAVKSLYGDGFALLGNAAEFLDPVFSSGVTLALESSSAAVSTLVRQLRGEIVDWERDFSDHVMRGVDCFRAYVRAWYDGTLPAIFYGQLWNENVSRSICSILAGYVWDERNMYVRQPERTLHLLAEHCRAWPRTS